jgi:hypothetical protein
MMLRLAAVSFFIWYVSPSNPPRPVTDADQHRSRGSSQRRSRVPSPSTVVDNPDHKHVEASSVMHDCSNTNLLLVERMRSQMRYRLLRPGRSVLLIPSDEAQQLTLPTAAVTIPCGCPSVVINPKTVTVCPTTTPCYQCYTGWGTFFVTETCSSTRRAAAAPTPTS